MKKIVYGLVIITAIIFLGCKSDKNKETQIEQTVVNAATASTSFGVRGNCGMCKTTIEKAANSIDGVAKATWDKNKKKIDISFDASKTTSNAVEKAIAASGYDTENVMGDLDAYEELPGCCKYDHDMKMNQTGEDKTKEAH